MPNSVFSFLFYYWTHMLHLNCQPKDCVLNLYQPLAVAWKSSCVSPLLNISYHLHVFSFFWKKKVETLFWSRFFNFVLLSVVSGNKFLDLFLDFWMDLFFFCLQYYFQVSVSVLRRVGAHFIICRVDVDSEDRLSSAKWIVLSCSFTVHVCVCVF